MSCPTEERLQTYLDGELPGNTAAHIRVHLEDCQECATVLRDMEQNFDSISAAFGAELPVAAPSAQLWARIETSLGIRTIPLAQSWVPRWFRWAPIPAVLAFGAIAWLAVGTRPETPGTAVRIPSTVEPPSTEVRRPDRQSPSVARSQTAGVSRRRRPRPEADPAETVTEFFPLRDGDDLSTIQGARVVRVELAGSALSEAGLPAALFAGNDRVTADVILAEDGLARAIRFVL